MQRFYALSCGIQASHPTTTSMCSPTWKLHRAGVTRVFTGVSLEACVIKSLMTWMSSISSPIPSPNVRLAQSWLTSHRVGLSGDQPRS